MKNTYTNYSLKMEYEPDGKILRKDVSASGNSMQTGYDNFYSYNTDQPHTISKLSDGQSFTWDKNGNMTEHFKSKHFVRYLAWDEENRLMGVADNNQVSFYLYDAAGERTVKFTGHNQWVDVNGIPQGYAGADKLTLYASPYLVASSGRYTKHYYAGEQRILSKIGGGGLGNYNAEIIAPETHRKKVAILENMVRFIGNTLYLKTLSVKPKPSVPCNQEGMLVDLCDYKNIVHPEEDRYFYHPDHLGSSSWITDRDGMPMQHLAYLPFGEEFVDQKTSNWSAAYKFSGKEKDEETGYNYFGARYYWSNGGIWLSPDPLSHLYPSLSSYNYCNNNPIILIDPDGKRLRLVGTEANNAFINLLKQFKGVNEDNLRNAFSLSNRGNINDYAFKEPITFKEFKSNFKNITGKKMNHKEAYSIYKAISNEKLLEVTILSSSQSSYSYQQGSAGTNLVKSIPDYTASENYNSEFRGMLESVERLSTNAFNKNYENSIDDGSGENWKFFKFRSRRNEENPFFKGTVIINGNKMQNMRQKQQTILDASSTLLLE